MRLRSSLLAGVLTLFTVSDACPVARATEPAAETDTGELAPNPDLPTKLTLDQAVQLFRAHGYDLLIADASVQSAAGNLTSAGQYANPSVNFGIGGAFGAAPGASANPFISAGVNDSGALLDTLVIGKRVLKAEVAQAALDSTKFSRTDAERTLVATLKQAFVSVIATKGQLDVNKEILASNESTEKLVVTRFNNGAANGADVANQKTATFEAAQQVEIANQAHEQAKVALAFLMGVRGATPQFEVDTSLFEAQPAKTVADATSDSLHDLARDHRPDVLAQRKQVARAEASIRLARRQVMPDFALGLAYGQQGVGSAAVSPPTLSADITVTPPLFYRQEGEITIAEADLRTQQLALAKLQAQLLSDVDSGYSAFGAARRRLARLDNGYLEQSKLALDLTKIQYEKGAASLVDVLVAQRTYVATVSEHVQALNDFWTAVFALEAATGVEFKS